MTETSTALATRQEFSLEAIQTMAQSVAKSGMFGVQTEAQAMSLLMIAHAEGIHPMMAVRRYHIIEGKPSMRADAMQGEFEQRGGVIIWHIRTDARCAATFLSDGKRDMEKAIARGRDRAIAIMKGDEEKEIELSYPGEVTIVRTIQDAQEKRICLSWDRDRKEWKMKANWKQSPRQMLSARCITEGVRAVNPAIVAGIYSDDEIDQINSQIEETIATADLIPGGTTEEAREFIKREAAYEERDRARLIEQGIDPSMNESITPTKKANAEDVKPKSWRDMSCDCISALQGKKLGDLKPKQLIQIRDKWLKERIESDTYDGHLDDFKAAVDLGIEHHSPCSTNAREPITEPA
jgi:hypothetical protein